MTGRADRSGGVETGGASGREPVPPYCEDAREPRPESSRLGQLRLLIALDAVLVEGSVGKAADRMGLSIAAMSRLLGQVRELYGDPLFVRAGRRLVPTPRAEALRQRVRALAAEADALLAGDVENADAADAEAIKSWSRRSIVEAPPLAMRPAFLFDDQPSPEELARSLARIADEANPCARLAKYLAVIGRKAGNSRPLSMSEAEDAFGIILDGAADPMQVSAFLRLIYYRGETAPELAGMALAARSRIEGASSATNADLDWPAYLSPKSLRAPWFLLAACLVAKAGHRVAVHGANGAGSNGGKLELAAEALGVPVCLSVGDALAALKDRRVVFLPLAGFAPQLSRLLGLYPLFEARSSINSVVHLLNPLGARASVLGAHQPAYRSLHRDAAKLLDCSDLSVIGSRRDVAELIPYRPVTVHRLRNGETFDIQTSALRRPPTLPRDGLTSLEYWRGIWLGDVQAPWAEHVVVATAALALQTLAPNGDYEFWRHKAEDLWRNRFGGRKAVIRPFSLGRNA
ncbi:MAG TPA: glycosyl transferase family protein [Hansschlegelia sp.]